MIRNIDAKVYIYRDGAQFGELLFDRNSPPGINALADAEIHMSLSGTFLPNEDMDLLRDELRPVLIINGEEFGVGYYPIGTVSDGISDYGRLWQIEAYDRGYIVKSFCAETRLHLDAGANYLTVVKQLLTQAGISSVIETPTAQVLAEDREDWDIGTDYLSIINTLLSEINYNSLWFNFDGVAVLEPYSEPDADSINYKYDGTTHASVISMDASVETDLFDKPNVFIAICDNPDKDDVMSATAENNNPGSALSIIRRGRRIARVYKIDNIADQDALQAYADRLCYESQLGSQTAIIQTALEPGHGIGDVIAINHPALSGICEETAWSMTLGAGQYMTHTLKKAVYQ